MPRDRCRSAPTWRRRAVPSVEAVCSSRNAEVHPLGQGPGVHGRRCSRLARAHRGRNAFHRARKSLGERLRGVVQRKAPRRALEPRDLRHALGGAGPDRRLAPRVQPIPTTQLSGVSSTGPRGDRTSSKSRRGYALRPSSGGSETMIEGGRVLGGRSGDDLTFGDVAEERLSAIPGARSSDSGVRPCLPLATESARRELRRSARYRLRCPCATNPRGCRRVWRRRFPPSKSNRPCR